VTANSVGHNVPDPFNVRRFKFTWELDVRVAQIICQYKRSKVTLPISRYALASGPAMHEVKTMSDYVSFQSELNGGLNGISPV
jgi:hypothetical protein